MLKRLTKSIYYLPHGENDRPNLVAIVGAKRTLLVDAGNSPSHAKSFLAELAAHSVSPISYVVLTHWHWDHSFGLSAMDGVSIAHTGTRKKLKELQTRNWDDISLDERVKSGLEMEFVRQNMVKEYPDPRRQIEVEIPDIAFSNFLEIDLGDVHCTVENVGGDHAADSCIIHIPSERVLIIGDCLYNNLYGKGEYTIDKSFQLIDHLLHYDVDIILASHDEPCASDFFTALCQTMKTVGSLVEQYGNDNSRIQQKLQKTVLYNETTEWTQDIANLIQSYLAGIKDLYC